MTPTRAEEDRRFLPIAAIAARAGVTGRLTIRFQDRVLIDGVLTAEGCRDEGPHEALAASLDAMFLALGRQQGMPLRLFDADLDVLPRALAEACPAIAPLPFPRLLRAAVLVRATDMARERLDLLLKWRELEGILLRPADSPHYIRYSAASIAAMTGVPEIEHLFLRWREDLASLLSADAHGDFQGTIRAPSAHDSLEAAAELARLIEAHRREDLR